jgi:hypothetical protein
MNDTGATRTRFADTAEEAVGRADLSDRVSMWATGPGTAFVYVRGTAEEVEPLHARLVGELHAAGLDAEVRLGVVKIGDDEE